MLQWLPRFSLHTHLVALCVRFPKSKTNLPPAGPPVASSNVWRHPHIDVHKPIIYSSQHPSQRTPLKSGVSSTQYYTVMCTTVGSDHCGTTERKCESQFAQGGRHVAQASHRQPSAARRRGLPASEVAIAPPRERLQVWLTIARGVLRSARNGSTASALSMRCA